jgi:hypothetical protein
LDEEVEGLGKKTEAWVETQDKEDEEETPETDE